MPVEDVFAPKPKSVTNVNSHEIDEVQKTAERISVIDDTIGKAEKLAGLKGYQEQLKRQEAKMEELEKEKRKIEQQLQESRMEVIQKELGGKIDHLSEALKAGATPKSIAEEIAEVKKTASELGLGSSRLSELREMMALVSSLNTSKGLAEQVREAKDLLETLKPEREPDIARIPANVTLELKRMDRDLQLEIQRMQDERQRRDQEWQLTVRKWEEEREMRKDELAAKVKMEEDKNKLIGDGFERLGRVFAQATSEMSQEAAGGVSSQVIEAGVGEFGEIPCLKCNSSVPIARDGVRAVCPSCGQQYNIKRVPVREETPSEN